MVDNGGLGLCLSFWMDVMGWDCCAIYIFDHIANVLIMSIASGLHHYLLTFTRANHQATCSLAPFAH